MLEIDERVSWKEIPEYINEQMDYVETYNIKAGLAITMFLMIDFFMIIPLFFPLIPLYLYIVLPPFVIINLWCISILVRNRFTVQYETILILAVMGIFASPAYIILAHKMAYYYAGIDNWSYYAIVTLLYVLTTLWILLYRLSHFKDLSYETLVKWKKEEQELKRGKRKKRGMRNADKYMAILLYVPAIGYLIAQSIKHSETGVAFILILCFLGFASFFSYVGIKFTHRIFVMKANPRFVRPHTPSKSQYKHGVVSRDLKIK